MPDWNSAQYLKFKRERTQPSIDLINRIDLEAPADIIDIGCGPGNSTERLKNRYPNAQIIGADSSPEMIKAAKSEYPEMEFILCDASKELSSIGRKFDIVFSNACIQWIPNHETLIPNMIELLKSGGVLAVQVPMIYDEPIQKIINRVSTSEKWTGKFPARRIFYYLTPSDYFDILSRCTKDFNMWETIYCHRMKSHEDIMEWYKGTGLRPYLGVLSGQDAAEFERDILGEVKKAYPVQENGEIIFRFPRLFFTAVKK